MAGKIHPDKTKLTYGEWKSIRAEIVKAAGEENLTEPEMMRKITLEFANKFRAKKKKKPLVLDYKSGNNGGSGRQDDPPPLKWDRRKRKYIAAKKAA